MVTVQNIYLQFLCNELAILSLAAPLILHFHFRDYQDDIHVQVGVLFSSEEDRGRREWR